MDSIKLTKPQKEVVLLMADGWELVGYPDTQKQRVMWYLRNGPAPYKDVHGNVANNLLTKKMVTSKRPYDSNLFELTEQGKYAAKIFKLA